MSVYNCYKCEFHTANKAHWNIHLSTKKHTRDNVKVSNACACGKTYKYNQDLKLHMMSCKSVSAETFESTENKQTTESRDAATAAEIDRLNAIISLLKDENARLDNENKELKIEIRVQKENNDKILQHNQQIGRAICNAQPTERPNKQQLIAAQLAKYTNAYKYKNFTDTIQIPHDIMNNFLTMDSVSVFKLIITHILESVSPDVRPFHCFNRKNKEGILGSRNILMVNTPDGWIEDTDKNYINMFISCVGRKLGGASSHYIGNDDISKRIFEPSSKISCTTRISEIHFNDIRKHIANLISHD